METISTLVDSAINRHVSRGKEAKEIKEDIATNLEFRLLFTIDFSKTFKEARKEFLKNYFNDLLVLSLGNISLAAKKAQLHRRHIHRIITELDIDTESHRRELVKPAEYMKENIHQILEGTLSGFDESKIKRIYSNLDDISQIIAEHIGHHSYEDAVEVFEKEYLEKALKNNEYNVQRTAAAIDVGKRTLYRKMSKLNIAVA